MRIGTACAVACAAVALAACQSDRSTIPPALESSIGARAPGSMPRSGHLPDCTAPTQKLPGTYIFLDAQGNVKHGAYSTTEGIWTQARVTSTSAPSATPSSEPNAPKQSAFVYIGTYHLQKTGQTGCVYLVTSADGGPLMGSDNSVFTAQPDFRTDFFNTTIAKRGHLVANLHRLSASGGSGAVILKMGGRTYDTGTVVLTRRVRRQAPAPTLRHPAEAPLRSQQSIRPDYAFSCDPTQYLNKTVVNVTAGVATALPAFNSGSGEDQFFAVFGFCGVDNSFLGPSLVSSVQKYRYAGESSRSLEYTEATFASGYEWSQHPYVAVWEEDWLWGWVRAGYKDRHVTLVNVR